MAYEQRDNTGTLFKNNRKTEPNHSDYNGTMKIDGIEYWLNAWVKDGARGKFFSLSIKPKQAPKPSGTLAEQMDDSIPF